MEDTWIEKPCGLHVLDKIVKVEDKILDNHVSDKIRKNENKKRGETVTIPSL